MSDPSSAMRASILNEIIQCRKWLTIIEKSLQEGGVIPWVEVETLAETSTRIAYQSGRLNQSLMAND